MIDFEQVWLPQIVTYAKLISSGQLADEWLGRAAPATSVSGPDELCEQVFDDLDADRVWADTANRHKLQPEAAEAIDSFISALRKIEGDDPRLVVASEAWQRARQAARAVVLKVS